MEEKKKSTYNAEYQKRYNEKRKKIACNVSNDLYEDIKLHAGNKGFTSINSYVLDLIKKDMHL